MIIFKAALGDEAVHAPLENKCILEQIAFHFQEFSLTLSQKKQKCWNLIE